MEKDMTIRELAGLMGRWFGAGGEDAPMPLEKIAMELADMNAMLRDIAIALEAIQHGEN